MLVRIFFLFLTPGQESNVWTIVALENIAGQGNMSAASSAWSPNVTFLLNWDLTRKFGGGGKKNR